MDAAALAALPLEERKALLKRLLAQRGASRPAAPPRKHPLSHSQRRLWFLEQLDPGTPNYNIPMAVRFVGHLKYPVLERVVQEIARRHETLRTTFVQGDDEPQQVISPESQLLVRQADLRALSASRREEEMRRLAGIEVLCPFDLAQGPLARVLLLRVEKSEQVAVVTLHHIIADGWSMGVLIHELRVLYEAFDAGRPSPLPELPIQYVDFAHWQRRRMDENRLEPGLAYWREQLAGDLPVLELPTDRPRTTDIGNDGRILWFELSPSLVGSLRNLGEELGGTLFMVLLAGYSTLISRYSGQPEVLFGTPVANRHRRELEPLIGMFVNALVLRCDLHGNPLFSTLFERLREMTLGALAHQEIPFERLVEELHPNRDLAHHPFFQAMFVLQNVPYERLELPELTLEPYDLEQRAEVFDMSLSFMEVEEGILGSLTYNTRLYDATTMRRFLHHLEQLLESIVEAPACRLSNLEFLTPSERQQLFERWPAAQGGELAVDALFTAQAERTPEAAALIDQGRVLSYGALAHEAVRLAHRLRRAGVGVDTVVGMALEPSADAVITLLGILRAGGAYLPLDRNHPARRLRTQLELCQVPLVVTRERWSEHFTELGDASAERRMLLIDEPVPSLPNDELQRAASAPLPPADGLAYVLFTSGSTGEPKGVAMPHAALFNLIRWQQGNVPLDPGERCTQLASLGFDGSFQELFSTLSWGGTVVIVPESLRRNPDGWPDILERHRIGRFIVPFVGLERLAEALTEEDGDHKKGASLRHLITAGEQLRSTERLVRLFERLPSLTLHNHYGPTESHVVTSYTLAGPSTSWPALPPIGRAIDGSPARILDQHLHLVPDGVVGEIFLAGVALARGYISRPGLTAERFIPDPWCDFPGGRIYRTGDYGRHLKDGEIEFLGRKDHQMKVRGFRIEPGEIETALEAHPAVVEAAVVGREGTAGKVRLVAYVVARSGAVPAVGELRHFLGDRLPEYMVPTAFAFLDVLPTTATGKIDRLSLPELSSSRPSHLPALVPPRNDTEQRLAEGFSRALGVDTIGVDDHFLELGGDSILALQVVVHVRRAGLTVKLEHLFSHPTVAQLAEVAEQADGGSGTDAADQAAWWETEGDLEGGAAAFRDRFLAGNPDFEDLYPLSPMQQGILFHHLLGQAEGEYVEYFRSGLRGLDASLFQRALEEVIALHPVLRTVFFWQQEGEPLQGVLRDLPLPFERHDLRDLDSAARDEAIRAYGAPKSLAARFDPGQGPLHHFALFHLTDDTWELIWSYHHLILDGWSILRVLDQVSERYHRLADPSKEDEMQAPLETPPTFRHYVDWLAGQDSTGAEDFWRGYLEGYEPPSSPAAVETASWGEEDPYGWHEMVLPEAVTHHLGEQARRRRLTLNTLLQAAWAIVLARFQGAENVVFGSVVSGRPADFVGSGEVIGVPANTLPVRLWVNPNASRGPWLEELQRQQVTARRYEHIPLVKIHRWSGVPREAALFDSILDFVNFPPAENSFWHHQSWSPSRTGYPLFLLVRPGKEISLELTFGRRHFNGTTAARMLRQLQTVLEGLVEDPEGTLAELPFLHAAERHQMLVEWNDTVRPLPETTAMEEIDAWAEAVPERIAASAAGGSNAVLSYRTLLRHAAGVATELQSRGLEPGTLVPILAPRGLEFLVSMLALWRAGAAYLPLDPDHPPERLQQILGRSGSRWALVGESMRPLLGAAIEAMPTDDPPRVIEMGELLEAGRQQRPQPSRVVADGLAYTIFTSGSTGVPKGAMVHHRGMLNHLRAKITDLDLRALDRVAQTAFPML